METLEKPFFVDGYTADDFPLVFYISRDDGWCWTNWLQGFWKNYGFSVSYFHKEDGGWVVIVLVPE